MYYIIQESVFRQSNYNRIFETLDKLQLPYEIVECLPFVEEYEFNTDRKDIFVFGSVKMARISKQNGWYPGSFYGDNHDYMVYSKPYKGNLLNDGSFILQLTDKLQWETNEVKFIRPCKDSKIFNGGLYTKTKWEDILAFNVSTLEKLTEDTLIQVNSPQVIYKEARVWIVDGKVITSSYYFFNKNVEWAESVDPEGLAFAQSMVNIYQVAPAFVMDICLTPDGWKIVEINCINCSGFYQGDLQKVIIALEDLYN